MSKVFVSYAREDAEIADQLYRSLRMAGINAWMDKHDLLPGQDWDLAIKQEMKSSSHFVCLLSTASVTKKGYVQREIRQALDIAEGFPPGEIWIIPVRINNCEPLHPALRKLHYVDLFPVYRIGMKRVLAVFGINQEDRSEYVTITIPFTSLTEELMVYGRVSRLADRGFGFVSIESRAKDIFFHISELRGEIGRAHV